MSLHLGGLLNGMFQRLFRMIGKFIGKLTKPDIFVFLFWGLLGGFTSSDETENLLLNIWHGFILGAIFLGFFKFFKMGIYK
jgi:hypothetical protein